MALWNARLDFALDSWAHVVRPLLVPTLYWWPLLLHRQAAIYARNYAAEEPQKPIPQKDWAMDIVDKQPFMFIHTCWHWVEPPGRSSAAPTLRSGWNCCHIECTAVSRDLININEHVAIQSDSVCGKNRPIGFPTRLAPQTVLRSCEAMARVYHCHDQSEQAWRLRACSTVGLGQNRESPTA